MLKKQCLSALCKRMPSHVKREAYKLLLLLPSLGFTDAYSCDSASGLCLHVERSVSDLQPLGLYSTVDELSSLRAECGKQSSARSSGESVHS